MAEAQNHALQAPGNPTAAKPPAETVSPLEAALNLNPADPNAAPDSLPSLRQFLSRHLQHRENPKPDTNAASPSEKTSVSSTTQTPPEEAPFEHYSTLLTPFETFARGERMTEQAGYQLNQLDTEMAAGLEHMLPTPSFRFKVMRNRIANETMILEAKLAQYRGVSQPPAGLLAKIETLEQRLDTLKRHDAEIAFRQAAITVPPPLWVRAAKATQRGAIQGAKWLGRVLSTALAACSPLTVARKSNPMQMQLVQLNQQLGTLADVLDTELKQAGRGGMDDLEDVSSMLRQYEQLVRRGNRIGQVMASRQGLMDRANSWLQRHVRHWLTYWQG